MIEQPKTTFFLEKPNYVSPECDVIRLELESYILTDSLKLNNYKDGGFEDLEIC